MLRTQRALARHARRLTLDRGLNGFTVDQVCELAGVSRRTFFNYFPTKEAAVIGQPKGFGEEAIAAFRAARPAGANGLSPTLLDDLAALAVTMIGPLEEFDELDDPKPVITREPQLLATFIGAGHEAQRELAELVADREGLQPEDPVVVIVVAVFLAVVGSTVKRYFTPGNHVPFADLLDESLTTARTLLLPQTKGHQS
jgi:AcrR family transcriptional regulator